MCFKMRLNLFNDWAVLQLLATLAILTSVQCRKDKGFMLTKKAFYPEYVNKTAIQVSDLMHTSCLTDRIVVTFPQSRMEDLGIAHNQLSLIDLSCDGQSNGTHYLVTLSFSATLCGGNMNIDVPKDETIIKNAVHVNPPIVLVHTSDDEDGDGIDLDGSGMVEPLPVPVMDLRSFSLPFICTYPGSPERNEETVPARPKMTTTTTTPRNAPPNSFELHVYTTDTFTRRIPAVKLTMTENITVFGEVRPQRGSPYEKAFIHSCHLTDMERSKKYYLIQNGCPVDEGVKFLFEQHADFAGYRRFQFKMRKVFSMMTFVECDIEPCFLDKPFGDLQKCSKQAQYCKKQDSGQALYRVSWRQSVVVQAKPSNYVNSEPTNAPADLLPVHTASCPPVESPVCKCPAVPPDGSKSVTLGLALGVSAVTFCLGTALIGALWCIHYQTDHRRRMQAVPMSDDGSQNSQTPIKLLHDREVISRFDR